MYLLYQFIAAGIGTHTHKKCYFSSQGSRVIVLSVNGEKRPLLPKKRQLFLFITLLFPHNHALFLIFPYPLFYCLSQYMHAYTDTHTYMPKHEYMVTYCVTANLKSFDKFFKQLISTLFFLF